MSTETLSGRIGQVLRELRKERKLTLDRLADLLDLSKGHLSKIENGEMGLRVEVLADFAQVLNVTPAEIILRAERTEEEF